MPCKYVLQGQTNVMWAYKAIYTLCIFNKDTCAFVQWNKLWVCQGAVLSFHLIVYTNFSKSVNVYVYLLLRCWSPVCPQLPSSESRIYCEISGRIGPKTLNGRLINEMRRKGGGLSGEMRREWEGDEEMKCWGRWGEWEGLWKIKITKCENEMERKRKQTVMMLNQ